MCDIIELFKEKKSRGKYLNVAAPMVRYSKREFRQLVRQHNVDLCFTPMIVADSFIRSEEARSNEFTTDKEDRPLIAQFAAKNTKEVLAAAQLMYPYVDGVDLNCGCPQSWAIAKGFGCALLKNPDLIRDMITTLRRNFRSDFSCSLKLRLLNGDIKSTVNLCRQLESCGATFLSLHGRTQWEKTSHPLNIEAMTDIKASLRIPLVVNGNVRTLDDADQLYEQTKADGIMCARGLLANPGLFVGTQQTTLDCIQKWLDIAYTAGDDIAFQCFHHHLAFMWGKMMKRQQRVEFNNLTTKSQVLQFLENAYDIRPKKILNWLPKTSCTYDQRIIEHHMHKCDLDQAKQMEATRRGDGKYFTNYLKELDSDNEDDLYFQNGSIFDS